MAAPRYSKEEVSAALGKSVDEFLGAGAFGDTWRAGDSAIKVICDDSYPAERVAREVEGLQRVRSDYVVRLQSADTIQLDGKDRPALSFEYVAGGDLGGVRASGESVTTEQVDALLLGMLRGLRDMHAASSTVHRDIKPANVALRNGDWSKPVILDLGLARSMTEETFTVYPGHLGTPLFMAPEQIRGERARKAADLFATGVTVLTVIGTHPFYDAGAPPTWEEALGQITSGPRHLPEVLSPRAEEVLRRLVSVEEHERGSAVSNIKRMERNYDHDIRPPRG